MNFFEFMDLEFIKSKTSWLKKCLSMRYSWVLLRGLVMLGTLLLAAYWPKCCAARPVPIPRANNLLTNSNASHETSIFNSKVTNESEELFFVFSIKKRKDGTVLVKDILKLNVAQDDGDNDKNNMQKIVFQPDDITFSRTEKADNCSLKNTSGLFTINSSSTNLDDIVNLTLERPELRKLIGGDYETSTRQSQHNEPTLISNSGVISTNEIETYNQLLRKLSRRDRNIFAYNNSSNKINNNNLLLKHIKSNNNNNYKVKSLNLDRNERSANLSHITGTARKIQLYIKNRFLQLLPDGTVNGTTNELSDYSEYYLFIFFNVF